MTNQLEVQKKIENLPNVTPGFNSLQSFELSLRTANLLTKSTLVPKDYQNNLPNCVIALNMAGRMNADPLMVMQNLYIVHGKPGWSSQFLISTFNTSGRFSALRYEWSDKSTQNSDQWGCTAWAIEKATGEKLEGSLVTIDMAKKEGWYEKNGSKWKTMPQQMLMYRAASFFIRTYAPELAMGMRTEEEIIDMTESDNGTYEARVAQEVATNACTETIDIKTSEEPRLKSEDEIKPAEQQSQAQPQVQQEPDW